MIENAFIGKLTQPTPKELAAKLGASKELWNQTVTEITTECGITDNEWNCYSPKAGWSLRLKQKKRNIVHMAPGNGCFQVALILGDKAMKVAKAAHSSERFAKLIAEAVRYPEGNAIRVDITTADDVAVVKQLAHIKVEN